MALARPIARRQAEEIADGSRRQWGVEGVPSHVNRLARVIAREEFAPWAEEDIMANG